MTNDAVEHHTKVLVTGGSRGIGRAIVEHLYLAGYEVHFTFNSSEEKKDEILTWANQQDRENTLTAWRCDLTNTEETTSFCRELQEQAFFGFVHNAGHSYDTLAGAVDLDKAKSLMQLNYWSYVEIVKSLIRPMIRAKSGRLISISSIASLRGNAGNGIYAASKAALNAYTRVLASEYSRKGITSNAIAPGFIETDLLSRYEGDKSQMTAPIPLKRFGTSEEVADIVALLLKTPSYINGEVITVDGGLSACL